MSDGDLQREMARLNERLARIERRLGLEPDAPSQPDASDAETAAQVESRAHVTGPKSTAFQRLFQPDETPSPSLTPFHALGGARRREPEIIPFKPAPGMSAPPIPASSPPAESEPILDDRDGNDSARGIDSVHDVATPVTPSPIAASTSTSLEVLIGGKWMAWAGALILIVAAGLAVLVAVNEGWWGSLPPGFRCLTIAAFGAALLVAGEIALRRIGKPAAAGLISAGLGTLYVDAFAAARVFKLLPTEGAFILMGIVALGGFALTVRTRFLTIGVLSIIGGYLTPVLLRGQSDHDVQMLLYLSMLLGVSLALSGWMPRPFGTLRFVALGGHLIVAFAWVVSNAAQWQLAMVFMSAWWIMILVEAVMSALRSRGAIANVVMTMSATAAFVTGGCLVLNAGTLASAEWMGAFVAMVAIIGGITVIQFGSGVDALRERVRQPIDLLSVAIWLQCGVLIATSIALQFESLGQAIGWLTLGLAAIEMGRRLPSAGVSAFGLITVALATFRVCSLPVISMFGAMRSTFRTLFDVIGFDVSPWALLAFINVIGLHIAAHRLPRTIHWRVVRIALASFASVMWLGLCMRQAEGLTITAGWLICGLGLLALCRFEFARRAAYLDIALAVMAATAGRWLVIDALAHRLDRAWSADESMAFINWQMGLAISIAGAGWWACRALADREKERASERASLGDENPSNVGQFVFWQAVLIAGAMFGLIAICFEIDRGVAQSALNRVAGTFAPTHVRQLLFTLAWAIGSVVIAVIARTLAGGGNASGITRTWLLRRFAWSILAMCAIKWIVYDAPLLFATNRGLFHAATPLLNLQMIVGVALAGAMLALGVILATPRPDGDSAVETAHPMLALPRDLRSWMPVLASAMLLWGLTFEVDRLLVQAEPLPHWLAAFPPTHVRALLWTMLWLAGASIMFAIGLRRRQEALFGSGIILATLAAIAWLTMDTLAWRFVDPPVPVLPFINLQFAVGALCIMALALFARTVHRLPSQSLVEPSSGTSDRGLQPLALILLLLAVIGMIGLWLGSIEIDRIFDSPGQSMVKQSGLSVWWSLYAVGLVVLGFAKRASIVRYVGLALLTLTAIKVLSIDFASLNRLPRVLSFAAAGLLLILTSVVYAKLSPKLLRDEVDDGQTGM